MLKGTHTNRLPLLKDRRQNLLAHALVDLAEVGRTAYLGGKESLDVFEVRNARLGDVGEQVEDNSEGV